MSYKLLETSLLVESALPASAPRDSTQAIDAPLARHVTHVGCFFRRLA
jgi:hypothetical protein